MQDIFKHLALGGDTVVLWILLFASILSIAVMIERWRAFSKNKGDAAHFMDSLAARLDAHDLTGAEEVARASLRVEGRVALAGLQNFGKGAASVEEVMASRWLREKLELERYLIVLATLGNNAPFIGLFGTVLGIIRAFNDLALTGQSGVTVVMSGISGALVATAFGILVAIPAVVANNYFVTRLRQFQTNTDSVSRILMAYLKEERKS